MPSGYSTATAGQELTTEHVAALLVEPLLASSVFLASSPRIFDSRSGVPPRIPKIAALTLNDPCRREHPHCRDGPTYSELTTSEHP